MNYILDNSGRRIVPDWWMCGCGTYHLRSEFECAECRQVRKDGAAAELGPLYQALRERLGLSRGQLAHRTKVSLNTIFRLEHGETHRPSERMLDALDDVLFGRKNR